MVRGEHHVGAVGERVDGLGEVAGPAVRVADQRPAQRQQVVQIVGGVLGHAQGPVLREVEVHLSGSLSAGRHLEFDLDAVDRVCLAGGADVERRHDQRHFTGGRVLSQSASDLSLWSGGQHRAVHVRRAPRHRRAGVDVLLHSVLGESLRRQHDDLARVHVGLVGDAEDAAEMVCVAVGIDDCGDGPISAVFAVERQRRGGGFGRDQRVDHDDAGIALDEADVRQVETANLIDAFDHLVEALLGGQR